MSRGNLLVWAACLCLGFDVVEGADQEEYRPEIAGASQAGQRAIRQFQVPPGFTVELAAAEPLVANVVAFCIDERGRIFAAETFRQQKGVEDNRYHMDWLEDDLAAETVEDRQAFFAKHMGAKLADYAVQHDRLRLLTDRDGDGRYETSQVFADGFNDVLDGTGAGVLARRGDVYYTCIPNLWLLRDADGDGQADERTSLHRGYGVRVAFRGHDLHGLCFGPDGKLYFSVGDRGYHIETEGKTLARPDTGAVFRCEADGSGLEVFAYGLRNPQELAFNELGDLFTCDNNSDSDDQARVVHVVEGGDSGWRMYFQYLADRGPWNRDLRWRPHGENREAAVVPPLMNLADGPSGLARDPGLNLPPELRGAFFLCDFRGTNSVSGVRTFHVEPRGASYSVTRDGKFVWNVLATDIDFGFDGHIYISDWVEGWDGPGVGRIYRVRQSQTGGANEVATLFAEGFRHRTIEALVNLLSHPDQRARQEAQFALAERGIDAIEALTRVAKSRQSRLPRLHAVWGLGQVAKTASAALDPVLELSQDDDAEVRRVAARVLGDHRHKAAAKQLEKLLRDESSRVRAEAAIALGKCGDHAAVGELAALAERNADRDPFLRHACVMGLAGVARPSDLVALAAHDAAAARRAGLLAARRLGLPEVAVWLNDADAEIVADAARAIYDEPIAAAMPALAACLSRHPTLNEAALSRAVAAAYEVGGQEQAEALANVAASEVASAIRVEAVESLAAWSDESKRDRLNGRSRRRNPGVAEHAAHAFARVANQLLSSAPPMQVAAASAAARLSLTECAPKLAELAIAGAVDDEARLAAFNALVRLDEPRAAHLAGDLATADSAALRARALRVLVKLDTPRALPALTRALEQGSLEEQRAALTLAAELGTPETDMLLGEWLARLTSGGVADELRLDLIEAAGARPSLSDRLARHESARSATDPLASHRETLVGGDIELGRALFFDRADLSCVRCHRAEERGGGVGPDLSDVGARQSREYLLESLLLPSSKIAKGFETAVVVTLDGRALAGIVREDDEEELSLVTPDGKLIHLKKSEIDERSTGQSAMPDTVGKMLTKRELRDLIAYLASLKSHPSAPAH